MSDHPVFRRRASTADREAQRQREQEHIALSKSDYRKAHGPSDTCNWPMKGGKRCGKTLGHSFGHGNPHD